MYVDGLASGLPMTDIPNEKGGLAARLEEQLSMSYALVAWAPIA